jgi:hypothetical protein
MYKILIKGEKEERIVDDSLGAHITGLWNSDGNDRVRVTIGNTTILCGDIKRIEKFGLQENAWEKKRLSELQSNLEEIDRCNRKLQGLSPEDRATAEIKDRILNGLDEKQQESFIPLYESTHGLFVRYFTKNPGMPRCPLENWVKILKSLKIRPTGFFAVVVRNDGAIEGWLHSTGEWGGFVDSSYNLTGGDSI